MYKIWNFLTVKYFMKYFDNVYIFNNISKRNAITPDLFLSAPWGHCTHLVMPNTYNYVVLGWNTTSTSLFTTLKTILLGFGPVEKHVADIAQKHMADIAQ